MASNAADISHEIYYSDINMRHIQIGICLTVPARRAQDLQIGSNAHWNNPQPFTSIWLLKHITVKILDATSLFRIPVPILI